MKQLDAIRLSDRLKHRLIDFSLNSCFVKDAKLREICKEIWAGEPEDGGLVSDLWVEGAFASKVSDKTLKYFVDQGIFDRNLASHLSKDDIIPAERKLYTHQASAIEIAATKKNPALLITVGTGAGKTESFLLPMLNRLAKDRGGNGVKCIILYPMNALVNDQVERLYEWLKGQQWFTLFHFTSETPESSKYLFKYPLKIERYEPCRMNSRQQARGLEDAMGRPRIGGAQPDILITNYSMLEYMLCRPQDRVFFGDGLKCIILDEAHLYNGTLAAEITLLLRRVMLRCGVRPEEILQIATSATIGTGNDQELRKFASTIFSKPEEMVELIKGEPMRVELAEPLGPINAQPFDTDLLTSSTISIEKQMADEPQYIPVLTAVDEQACRALAERLKRLVREDVVDNALKESKGVVAHLLYSTLRHAPLIHKLEDILWSKKQLSLKDLSVSLFGSSGESEQRATVNLLKAAAAARRRISDLPLIPHRIHILASSATGLGVCLNTDCTGSHKLGRLGSVTGKVTSVCRHCDSQVLSICRCNQCGEWLLAYKKTEKEFLTCRDVGKEKFSIDPKTGEEVSSIGRELCFSKVSECPNCESRNSIERMSIPSTLTRSIIAEAILCELPEYPSSDNIYLPARGRRILAFSDSRRAAARLGPGLRRQHEMQVIRAAIAECLKSNSVSSTVIEYRRRRLKELEAQIDETSDISLKEELKKELKETELKLKYDLAGRTPKEWVEKLSLERIQELMEYESSKKHYVPWSQQQWHDNYEQVRKSLEFEIGRELAHRVSNSDHSRVYRAG